MPFPSHFNRMAFLPRTRQGHHYCSTANPTSISCTSPAFFVYPNRFFCGTKCTLRTRADFVSEIESEASRAIFVKRAREVVIILPTGGGKSLFFMLGYFLDEGRFTLVVLPLRALIYDVGLTSAI